MPKGKRHVKARRAVQFLLPYNIIEYFSLYILYKSSCDILEKNVTDSKESPRNAVQLDKLFQKPEAPFHRSTNDLPFLY